MYAVLVTIEEIKTIISYCGKTYQLKDNKASSINSADPDKTALKSILIMVFTVCFS